MERGTAVPDDEPIDRDEAERLLTTTDVAALGSRADARRRQAHGDAVHYGPEPADGRAGTYDGAVERVAGDNVVEPDAVADDVVAVVTGPAWHIEDHASLHGSGVATDAAAVYGEPPEGPADADEADGAGNETFLDTLMALRGLSRRTGGLRCVRCDPGHGRTTAYDDLRAVAVARLVLDDAVHVRVDRGAVGDKLTQTALAYGVDDVGFAGDHGFDTELLIEEAGDVPVVRGTDYHG